MADPAFRSASQWAKAIRAKKISSRELLELYLDRVRRFNPLLNAVIATDVPAAKKRARAADQALARGKVFGPLHGVPMTLKESYDLKGLPSTWGVPALAENRPAENAVVTQRFLDAGAVIFGKTNVPLLLADFQSYNEIYGTTNNPWDETRAPGGSSGGSAAALAAGLTALESGSDIGGSIRNPAHFCGVYGHKPTHGIIPPRGHALPGIVTPSDVSVVGPLARSAEDLALALDVIAGPDVLQTPGWELKLPRPEKTRLRQHRVATWLEEPRLCTVADEVRDCLDQTAAAIRKAGAKVNPAARPEFDVEASNELFLTLILAVMNARRPQPDFEAALSSSGRLDADDRSFAARQIRAAVMRYRDWAAANEARNHMRYRWREFFRNYDVLLCPVMGVAAFPHDHSDINVRTLTIDGKRTDYWDQIFWCGLPSVSYLPSTIAPIGRTKHGLPVGIQIIGPELGDRTTIAFAKLLAQEIGAFTPPPNYA